MTCREKILSEDYLDILTYYSLMGREFEQERKTGAFCDIPVTDQLLAVFFDRSRLPSLNFADYDYRYVTALYGLMEEFVPGTAGNAFNPQPLLKSGISQVQGPPLELTGRNTVIGFADTGIDYRNPVFRRSDGSTRILAIWDQTVQTGKPPEGLYYGSEYTREQINEALSLDDPLSLVPTTDDLGHGSAMASVAAGSALNEGLDFLGAAPDADLVVVKLKQAKQVFRDFYMLPDGVPAYQATDVALAVKYLNSFVIPLKRPLVVCLGIGRSFGSHVGKSPLSRYLSELGSGVNRLVVTAGGNEGNTAHHYAGNLTAGTQDVEIRVEENTRGFLMEVWGIFSGTFSLSLLSPGGERLPEVSGRVGTRQEYTFVYGRTRVEIDYQLIDWITGFEVAVIRFENPGPGIWTVRISREEDRGQGRVGLPAGPPGNPLTEGQFHMWLPIRQFVDGRVEFLRPTPRTTITAPGYAQDALTVSAYDSSSNGFYINSGQGFGPLGMIKPELAAPGVDVSAAVGRQQGRAVVGSLTGTSLSAALTSGACAQLFQWCVDEGNYRDISGVGIRNYLIRGAARETAYTYPSRQWGYGRLDLEGTMNWIAGI